MARDFNVNSMESDTPKEDTVTARTTPTRQRSPTNDDNTVGMEGGTAVGSKLTHEKIKGKKKVDMGATRAFLEEDSGDESKSESTERGESVDKEAPSIGRSTCPVGFDGVGDRHLLILGWLLGLGVVYWTQERWISHQLSTSDDGSLVSRVSVCLLPLFVFGFVSWVEETFLALKLLNEVGFPGFHFQMEAVRKLCEGSVFWRLLLLLKDILFVPVFTLAASRLWRATWRNLICKSFNDRSCKYNAVGRWLAAYRNSACLDSDAPTVMCERIVTYIPFAGITLIALFAGMILVPMLNNFLVPLVGDIRRAADSALLKAEQLDDEIRKDFSDAGDVSGGDQEMNTPEGSTTTTRRRSPRFAAAGLGDGDAATTAAQN